MKAGSSPSEKQRWSQELLNQCNSRTTTRGSYCVRATVGEVGFGNEDSNWLCWRLCLACESLFNAQWLCFIIQQAVGTVIQCGEQRYEVPHSVVLIDSLRSVTITALEDCVPHTQSVCTVAPNQWKSVSVVSTSDGRYLYQLPFVYICTIMFNSGQYFPWTKIQQWPVQQLKALFCKNPFEKTLQE